jgi:hypothetical protein
MSKEYYQFPISQPAQAPAPAPSPIPTQPVEGKHNLDDRKYVTKDAYCLYTAQGQMICNKKAEKLPIAPWGSEKF